MSKPKPIYLDGKYCLPDAEPPLVEPLALRSEASGSIKSLLLNVNKSCAFTYTRTLPKPTAFVHCLGNV